MSGLFLRDMRNDPPTVIPNVARDGQPVLWCAGPISVAVPTQLIISIFTTITQTKVYCPCQVT